MGIEDETASLMGYLGDKKRVVLHLNTPLANTVTVKYLSSLLYKNGDEN